MDIAFVSAVELWKKLEYSLAIIRPNDFSNLKKVGEIIKVCQECIFFRLGSSFDGRLANIQDIIIRNTPPLKNFWDTPEINLLARTKRHAEFSLVISGHEYDNIIKDIEAFYSIKITFIDTARAKHNTKLIKIHYSKKDNPLDLNSATAFADFIFYCHSLAISDWREAKYSSKR